MGAASHGDCMPSRSWSTRRRARRSSAPACTSGRARAHERGRIALDGDAGHLMLVNLGRSACQAVEDAVVLADELATSHDVVSALSRYNARRVPHTAAVVGHVPQPAPSTQAT